MGGMQAFAGKIGPCRRRYQYTHASHLPWPFYFFSKVKDEKAEFIIEDNLTEATRPLNDMTAQEVLAEEGNFTNFARALELSGVGGWLEKKGPYTVFAPSDDVFNQETIGGMIGAAKLDDLLWHFIVPGKYSFEDLHRLQMLMTVSGYPLIITTAGGIRVSGAEIIRPDIPYNKGIIHEIDRPPETLPQ